MTVPEHGIIGAWPYPASGDYNRAISCYDKALEHSPDDPLLWRRRGFALLKAGRYAEAAASFDRALAIDPDDATAWQRKGYALACMGRVEDSIACCNQALELNPKHILAWQNKGWVLGSACRYDEAAACYEAVLRLDPNRESAAWHREYLRRKKESRRLHLRSGRRRRTSTCRPASATSSRSRTTKTLVSPGRSSGNSSGRRSRRRSRTGERPRAAPVHLSPSGCYLN